MGEDDSSTLMLGAMCWLLGEEKAKKLARSVGKVSKEYKRTLKEMEIDIIEPKNVLDVRKLARGFAIDTEDKSKQDILAEIQAKTLDGRYDASVDPFEDSGGYVPTPPSTLPSEEPSEEESSEEPSEEESSEEPSEEESSEEPSEEPSEEESSEEPSEEESSEEPKQVK